METNHKQILFELDRRFNRLEEKHTKDFEILNSFMYDIYGLTYKSKFSLNLSKPVHKRTTL
jgi:hypothetical protein